VRKDLFGSLTLIAAATLAVGCAPREVSFGKEVQPILAKNCSECHAPGQQGFNASGLDTTSYETLMKGGKFGALVKPGDAFTSALNMLVEGRADKSIQMPHGREKLTDAELATLKNWVNQGAKNN
jgi:uncharacterized membrane protein